MLNSGEEYPCTILSVRMHELIVEKEGHTYTDSTHNSILLVPIDKIKAVQYRPRGDIGAAALTGGILGAFTYVVGSLIPSDVSQGRLIGVSFGAVLVGGGVGYILSTAGSTLYLERTNDWVTLKSRSQYPNEEPDELKKIK